jgi:hypothetical protein
MEIVEMGVEVEVEARWLKSYATVPLACDVRTFASHLRVGTSIGNNHRLNRAEGQVVTKRYREDAKAQNLANEIVQFPFPFYTHEFCTDRRPTDMSSGGFITPVENPHLVVSRNFVYSNPFSICS